MAKMIKDDECPEGLPAWLATFGDLMSLLLTFFVLLLSFSSMEVIKFNKAMGSLRASLGVFDSKPELSQPIRTTMPMVRGSVAQSQNIRKSAEELEKSLTDEGFDGDISLEGTASGLVIRIQTPVLYNVGGAILSKDIKPVLDKVVMLLKLLPNEIVVQGHTDNQPIGRGSRYPSNWELSYQRAVSVVRYLIAPDDNSRLALEEVQSIPGRVENIGVYPNRVSAEGYGEYRPLVANTTDANQRRNRRVEIHIVYAGESDGNLEIIADAFKKNEVEGERESGTPILRKRSWE